MQCQNISISKHGNWQPGSRDTVLKNKLGIITESEMEEAETRALKKVYLKPTIWAKFEYNHQFTAEDIFFLHKIWLETIYWFAGKPREDNISKNGFHFAAADQIEHLMNNLEAEVLKKYTPCRANLSCDDIAEALSIVHTELILIHPFREGNGRIARLLADLMATQAKLPPLNYALFNKNK